MKTIFNEWGGIMFESFAKDVINDLRELAKLTSDENGAQRLAWGPEWRKAREWYIEKAKSFGGEISNDSAGNLWVKIPGKVEEAVAIGSHIDCVPNGGWLDGCLGVMAGLGFLRMLNGKEKPEKTIYVVDWADEEGARFGRSLQGSAAANGTLDISEIIHREDNDGNKLKDVLAQNNVNVCDLLKAHDEFKQKNIKTYLELHIEQGPVLENAGKDVACVYGITGVERWYIRFHGQAAHAGSFPVPMRKDAFLAAAEASLGFRDIALKYNAVCTVGKVRVKPDVVTIVPEYCEISLDQRSIHKEDLEKMVQEARQVAQKAAENNRVEVSWDKICTIAPTVFDKDLLTLCRQSVKEETGEEVEIYSGPLHDAAEMAKIVPSVMMFAMSQRGLSHCKEENTSDASLSKAICAFLKLATKVVEI